MSAVRLSLAATLATTCLSLAASTIALTTSQPNAFTTSSKRSSEPYTESAPLSAAVTASAFVATALAATALATSSAQFTSTLTAGAGLYIQDGERDPGCHYCQD